MSRDQLAEAARDYGPTCRLSRLVDNLGPRPEILEKAIFRHPDKLLDRVEKLIARLAPEPSARLSRLSGPVAV